MSKFECSATASAHMYTVSEMLNDPRLLDWCKETDTNFLDCNETQQLLEQARAAYNKLIEVMEHAC